VKTKLNKMQLVWPPLLNCLNTPH